MLALIFVRPFRSERCDERFFAWSLNAIPNTLLEERNRESELLHQKPSFKVTRGFKPWSIWKKLVAQSEESDR
jgi:hypothetical protein